MSTSTKKAKIDEEHKKMIDSLKTTDQLYKELDAYIIQSKKQSNRAKERLGIEIKELGKEYIKEIESKEVQQKELYEQYQSKVEFIISKVGEKYATLKDMNKMTYEEIDSIYTKAKESTEKGFWSRLLDFFMGW